MCLSLFSSLEVMVDLPEVLELALSKQFIRSMADHCPWLSNRMCRDSNDVTYSAQRVPESDRLPSISFDTRPNSVLEIIR